MIQPCEQRHHLFNYESSMNFLGYPPAGCWVHGLVLFRPGRSMPCCWWAHDTMSHRAIFDGLIAYMDTGERESIADHPFPLHTYANIPLHKGMTLEQSLHALPEDPSAFVGMQSPREIRIQAIRLVCALCLLDNDPSIIEPDVLNRDQNKPVTDVIVDRAHRRGKIGWNVGRSIEVMPHVRRPHMALVWTGKGREIPKIVPRKGSVIHRNLVEKVPTGYAPKN